MNIEQARFNMIEQQIRPWDVLDPAVLSLLTLVVVPVVYCYLDDLATWAARLWHRRAQGAQPTA